MAASGGCTCLYGYSNLKQPVLLEQMIVKGALCSKASIALAKLLAFLEREKRKAC